MIRLYRILALMRKYWYISTNRMDRLFDIIYWPVLDIFTWGLASFYIQEISDVNVLSMLLGGIILWLFVWRSSQDLAVYTLEDIWSRNMYNLFSSPMKVSELVFSISIFTIARSLLTFGVLVGVSYLLYGFTASIFLNPVIFFLMFLLVLFGWVLGLAIASLIYRFGQSVQVFAWSLVWIIQPFSCVFYPLESLPMWAQSIAKYNPLAHVFETFRDILAGTAVNYGSLAYSVVVTLVLFVLSAWFLHSSISYAKKKGLFAKYD